MAPITIARRRLTDAMPYAEPVNYPAIFFSEMTKIDV
jgi:hypothetical protein